MAKSMVEQMQNPHPDLDKIKKQPVENKKDSNKKEDKEVK